ncbi:gustatory receptor for sugar taste 64a-like [Frankliniella occidentalis]|uniref:Gustatory receptor for sugar taste 64a-like n=1 Tax=Frankliniella occidentalis TaxID=133901 RepID=A0A6J1TGE0_FRAOC|nr:gustatory receptor for sugar taste 64a-like [Frankliniella occidentalis]
MSFALGELLLQVTTFALPKQARDYPSFSALLQAHYEALYDNMAQALPYSVPSLLLAEFTTAATNFVLNYNDVFVIIVSIAIVRRFKIIRGQLGRATTQDDAFDWKHARESFNDLSQLTREVDNTLSSLVLLSCLNNFFSICIQLQHTVR